MKGLGRVLLGLTLFLAFGVGAIAQLDGLHAAHARMSARGEPLYLPSTTALRIAAVGHETTLADLMYLWSIQYFSGRVESDKRPWIAQVYDRITDLDPHFRDAYWLGFVSLMVDARDPGAAFELADKAIENEPGFTLMVVEAALAARRLGDETRALDYLERASAATGDPLLTRLLLRLRETRTAQEELDGWNELLTSGDPLTRAIAESHVDDLTDHVLAETLGALVLCFERERGRPPRALEELVAIGWLEEVPLGVDGEPFVYDRSLREVTPARPYRFDPPTRAVEGVDLTHLGRCAPPPPLPPGAPVPLSDDG